MMNICMKSIKINYNFHIFRMPITKFTLKTLTLKSYLAPFKMLTYFQVNLQLTQLQLFNKYKIPVVKFNFNDFFAIYLIVVGTD